MSEHAVVIIGAGPAGLMLAAEIALAGVDVAIVERRVSQEMAGSRAGGLLPRTLELFDQRRIADRFVSQGKKHPVVLFPGAVLDTSDLPSRHNYWLAIWQNEIERTLLEWATELGVRIYREAELTDFAQNADGVELSLSDGRAMRATYLVGADGGRSVVRKKAGIAFPGWDADISYLIFEAEMTQEPPWGVRHALKGTIALGKLDEKKRVRAVLTEAEFKRGDEPSMDELREALTSAYGSDFGLHNVTWASRFTDAARQAAAYRDGRVLLVGDAAHVHSPAGGQGLNIAVQDSANLGWKLAQVAQGLSPPSLLDTYHNERHPVGARLLQHTMAITALSRGDDRTSALRAMLPEMIKMDGPRHWYASMMAGLDIHYDLGPGHPLLGRRMPDVDLITAAGPERAFALLHEGRHVLINFGASGRFDITPRQPRVRSIDAKREGALELPVLGEVDCPGAVLVRPDGYVAWVEESGERGLSDALEAWAGAA